MRRHTILYVEHNPANLDLMKSIITRIGNIHLVSAHTAELGLVVAEEEKPDLIIMDINLPGMDGVAALQHLKAEQTTHDIPVIAVSANAMPQDIKHAMAEGFQDYITKPFEMDVCLNAVQKALAKKQA